MHIIWWFPRNALSPKFSGFFQAACKKFIPISDTLLKFIAYDSKRFSRLMEWQCMPKLVSSDFSECFCGAHRVFTFIPPCCRGGWIKGWTKRCFKISCFSLSWQWSYDHYCSVTSPYFSLQNFPSLGSILLFLSWKEPSKQNYFLFWC